jgi:hypothetical protein
MSKSSFAPTIWSSTPRFRVKTQWFIPTSERDEIEDPTGAELPANFTRQNAISPFNDSMKTAPPFNFARHSRNSHVSKWRTVPEKRTPAPADAESELKRHENTRTSVLVLEIAPELELEKFDDQISAPIVSASVRRRRPESTASEEWANLRNVVRVTEIDRNFGDAHASDAHQGSGHPRRCIQIDRMCL